MTRRLSQGELLVRETTGYASSCVGWNSCPLPFWLVVIVVCGPKKKLPTKINQKELLDGDFGIRPVIARHVLEK